MLNRYWIIIPITVLDASQQYRLVLASASPRRKQLLEQIGLHVQVNPVDIDETPQAGESPEQLVARLSTSKAGRCLCSLKHTTPPVVCLGADTVIDLDGAILGKPVNREHAIEMLLMLADREHTVRTGVSLCLQQDDRCVCQVVSTTVRFGSISFDQAAQYWATQEPVDKAGGYAIQGRGAQFVAHLSGSYSNVVGLPLYETTELLRTSVPLVFQHINLPPAG